MGRSSSRSPTTAGSSRGRSRSRSTSKDRKMKKQKKLQQRSPSSDSGMPPSASPKVTDEAAEAMSEGNTPAPPPSPKEVDNEPVKTATKKKRNNSKKERKEKREGLQEEDGETDEENVSGEGPEPPKPVSSDDDEGSWTMATAPAKPQEEKDKTTTTTAVTGGGNNEMSRLFAPYRTVGVVTSGRPFHLIPNQNSNSAMLCIPIGERFHILSCERLQPILVSQKVPSLLSRSSSSSSLKPKKQQQQQPQHISHLVSDATLSISIVAHGHKNDPQQVTLYKRAQVIQTLQVTSQPKQTTTTTRGRQRQRNSYSSSWKIVDFLHLGRMKLEMTGEKEGKSENAVIVGAVLSNDTTPSSPSQKKSNSGEEEDAVPVVGDSDSDSSDDNDDDDDDSSSDSSASTEGDSTTTTIPKKWCQCQVVILLATRDSIRIHKRISLTSLPNFTPVVALHPSTYINKIILGGTTTTAITSNKEDTTATLFQALILLNIRTGKIIHNFSCIQQQQKSKKKKKGRHHWRGDSSSGTAITALEQSPAVDTVAVGNSHGRVYLINLRHDKALFVVDHKARDGSNKPVRIASISFRTDGSAQHYGIAPMAVGRSDGTITIWDLNPPSSSNDNDDDDDNKNNTNKKARTILTELFQVHAGGVSQVVYLPQEPLLVSIGKRSNSVLLHIFDSPDFSGRVLRQRKGHSAPPSRIRYLHPGASAGGGIMVNMADGTDASACQILSAAGGSDRTLRIFSTARSVLDKEYSQGKGLEKKARRLGMDGTSELLLPPITAMASCEARSRDWGDLVTIHKEHSMAYVWSNKRGSQWGPVLRQPSWNVSAMKAPPPPTTHASSVAMSACGNFAVVGTRGGTIYKYNVQSGNTRGTYPGDAGTDEDQQDGYQRKILIAGDVKRTMKALEKKMKISNRASNLDRRDQDAVNEAQVERRRLAKLKQACHTGSMVTGLAVDSTNKTMISVGDDAKLILWNFSTHAPHKKSPYKLPSPATMLCHVRDSDLAAIALEDYTTLLFDCTTLSIVRRFGAASARHSGPICDLAFSPDGRTLYTASLDRTIRVWDVPTNTCVDWLGFETAPTSLTVSATGEFLATSHIGKLGLSIWSDRSFYQTVNVNGAKELSEPFYMDEPKPIAEVGVKRSEDVPFNLVVSDRSASGSNDDSQSNAGAGEDAKLPAVAKESGLVTLSNLPPAHWKNLFHLELIKQRNKPKEPPKKPPSAPFFLQWRGGEGTGNSQGQENTEQLPNAAKEDDEWKAAWSSDDDEENDEGDDSTMDNAESSLKNDADSFRKKRELDSPSNNSRILKSGQTEKKRIKISHHRSRLATLLSECSNRPCKDGERRYQAVTDHIAGLGPSAIDVSLSSLCNGMHDLEEGLPLLQLACLWLIESCQSRERYEAVNAYLHRFLYLHATVIAGIEDPNWISLTNDDEHKDQEKKLSKAEQEEKERPEEERKELIESLSKLRQAQQSALDALNGKMQSSLCLLRHFSRMI